MATATAEANASIRYFTSTYWRPPALDAGVIARYVGQLASSRLRPLPTSVPEARIRTPHPMGATWLSAVERRIRGSIMPNGGELEKDGRWLEGDIADAGFEFFRSTSDLLPGEPFIYSSRKGDLVAEFEAPHGTLTSIVSRTFVLIFAVVDGTSTEKRASLSAKGLGELRPELRRLTELLRTGRYASVEPTK